MVKKPREKSNPEKPLARMWLPSELQLIWDFAQHDFARFIALLFWIDGLRDWSD